MPGGPARAPERLYRFYLAGFLITGLWTIALDMYLTACLRIGTVASLALAAASGTGYAAWGRWKLLRPRPPTGGPDG